MSAPTVATSAIPPRTMVEAHEESPEGREGVCVLGVAALDSLLDELADELAPSVAPASESPGVVGLG